MQNTVNFLKFNNPTDGVVVFGEMVRAVAKFIRESPGDRFRVMIGSDSNGHEELDVVSVVAVHCIGKGGRYFWHRMNRNGIHSLRDKIYAEVMASLELASLFLPAFRQEMNAVAAARVPYNFEIHVDVGHKGATRALVQEITGMVRGYGYKVMIKPESAAASFVADRHT